MTPSRNPITTFSTPFSASYPRRASFLRSASSAQMCAPQMGSSSARMNRPRRLIAAFPALRPASSPRGASTMRMMLPHPHSSKGGSFDRERALSVIECELLVLTYHCESQLRTAIHVYRAKWAPERSIPKHVQQNKITARRAARQRAKRARRGFCAPSSSVRLRGRRDRLGAGSKSDAVGKRESQPRV
jgi:hypothetical protein